MSDAWAFLWDSEMSADGFHRLLRAFRTEDLFRLRDYLRSQLRALPVHSARGAWLDIVQERVVHGELERRRLLSDGQRFSPLHPDRYTGGSGLRSGS